MRSEISLFAGSFVFVFALSMQQQYIQHRRYWQSAINATFIAGLNLMMVRLGVQASATEALAFIVGQPAGTLASLWLHDRWWSGKTAFGGLRERES